MRWSVLLSMLLCVVLLSGCASWRNSIARDGSMFTSTRGPYVVMSYSGGVVTDVWVLKDAYVQSEDDSDGWLFIDNDKNPINVGGDAKVIRLKDKRDLKNYREFHVEIDGGFYTAPGSTPLAGRYHLRTRTSNFFGRVG